MKGDEVIQAQVNQFRCLWQATTAVQTLDALWFSSRHRGFNMFSAYFFPPVFALLFYVFGKQQHIPKGALTKAICMRVVHVFLACVRVCVQVCVTLSGALLFNHLQEISNIPLKLNMKGNLLYFYALHLCRESGNYLPQSAWDLWKVRE